MAGLLYLVPTPIGNLDDLSRRTAETLAVADFIAAEDTRVTQKLLNHLGLKKPMVSYHRHNMETAGPQIAERILAGETCALVTDAGTPAISDPGEELVVRCAQMGILVCALPGPCALVTALAVSGLPTGRFTFEGFLPTNHRNRSARLDALREESRTMVFYEAPHRLRATLDDLIAQFGAERRISVCRELSKLYEEILRTTLGEAAERFRTEEPRGEFVLVVEGSPERPPEPIPTERGIVRVQDLCKMGYSVRDAVRQVSQETGIGKNELYSAVTKCK